MNLINKITSNQTVDFAAEELKKYIRMMMVESGDISINYSPSATNGIRIGLMADFGLDTSDAEDVNLDDIIYIDTDATGGIIAGSNPVATLIAVYRYLRFCGCRWIFPGIDGEWIPTIDILPQVNYRKLADHRYRGQCNEGAEYQSNMIETIEYSPKIGLNTYMLEFDNPYCYYESYYNHRDNSVRDKEPVSRDTVMKWKRQCECEIQKRGMHFHDMGHGWTAEPFGLDSSKGWKPTENLEIPEGMKEYMAMLDGERKVPRNVPLCNNVCMSNPEARRIMTEYIAKYAREHRNVDFLHIWLGDATNVHCECPECQKKLPSDWYIILLNELDEELTRQGLDTHIVFIAYFETFWAPLEEKLKDNKRFTLLYAPITRLYTETYGEEADMSKLVPYERNNINLPRGMGECLAYLHDWKNKMWSGDCFCYEYHFWYLQYFDITNLFMSKIVYEDIKSLKKHGLKGIIEDGSQRSYFPTGFQFYVYGETLFDSSVTFDDLVVDYFSHAFGENWQLVVEYLEELKELMRFSYLYGKESEDPDKGKYYNPDMVENIKKAKKLVNDFMPVIKANLNQSQRTVTVAWQVLELGAFCADKLTDLFRCLAIGDKENSLKIFNELTLAMSEREVYFERYYDHCLFMQSLRRYADVWDTIQA